VLLLSAFGLGASPVMPGTVASLAVAALLAATSPRPLAAVTLALLCVGVGSWVTLRMAGSVTGPEGRGDPGWVVSDEVAGQALAWLGALPHGGDWTATAVAFAAFRVLDVLKPWPVGALDRLPGARGILLDDLAAGLIAGLATLGAGALGLFEVLPR
jgi:phosphatidylglycerophosphatase A